MRADGLSVYQISNIPTLFPLHMAPTTLLRLVLQCYPILFLSRIGTKVDISFSMPDVLTCGNNANPHAYAYSKHLM